MQPQFGSLCDCRAETHTLCTQHGQRGLSVPAASPRQQARFVAGTSGRLVGALGAPCSVPMATGGVLPGGRTSLSPQLTALQGAPAPRPEVRGGWRRSLSVRLSAGRQAEPSGAATSSREKKQQTTKEGGVVCPFSTGANSC